MKLFSPLSLLVLLTGFILISCASVPETIVVEDPVIEAPQEKDISAVQKDLVDSANWALGKEKLTVKDRSFNLDCSGVVMAVYYRSGIDLQSYLSGYSGGGVQRLYGFLDDRQLLYKQADLAPGDMLFWDNTYDKNGDGKKNDTLTHVGMVVTVDERGNIQYIHHNYRKGIVLAKMNLLDPDNLDVNSPMRARGEEKGHAPLWLSSHLLKQAARGYELAE